jgi:hypothetical protein
MTLWPKERKRLNQTCFGRAGFGLHESVNFWQPPRLHPDSVLGVQVLDRNLIKSTLIWIRNHVHICFELAAIFDLPQTPFSVHGDVSPDFGSMGCVSSENQ